MIQAVFFDIDGTLYSHRTNSVPESARNALSAIHERGIRIYVASGRGLDSLSTMKVDDIPFDGYVMYNGQLCYNRDRQFLFGNPISDDGKLALLHLFSSRQYPVILVSEKGSVLNLSDDRVGQVQREFNLTVPPVGDADEKSRIYQALILATPAEEKIFESSLTECMITRWFSKGIDVIPKDGSKMAGILRIAAHDGIRPEEIMAFGDSENDIEMLQGASIGVAMGNADERTRRAADYITTDIDAGGIRNGLMHYGLLNVGHQNLQERCHCLMASVSNK